MAERLTESANVQVPTGITPDGTQVVFFENTRTAGADLRLLTLTPPAAGHAAARYALQRA